MADQPAGVPPNTVEHGSSRTARWLRRKRLNVAAWLALFEALLMVIGVYARTFALIIGALVIGAYFLTYYRDQNARRSRSGIGHDLLWIAAVAQAAVILVALLLIILKAIAIVAVGLIAALALFVLLTDRRKS